MTNTATVTATPKDRPEYEAQFKGTDTIDFKLEASKPVPVTYIIFLWKNNLTVEFLRLSKRS
ncbi:hypothetical protein MGH68_11450 [Erysipelothrix sp. D19-032]